MTHDESVYPEPFAFKPERFFDKNGELNDDDRILAYGFGLRYLLPFTAVNLFSRRSRVCVGKHAASASVGTH
jgi:cytochrome P450